MGYDTRFRGLYERVVREIVDALAAVDATWWLTEGSLIWALRYGRNHPSDVIDQVDDDIDVMVEVPSIADWSPLRSALCDALSERGWDNLHRAQTWRSRGARFDKLVARRREGGAEVHVDIHSYYPTRGGYTVHGSPRAYPFQCWGGVVPADLVKPLGVVAAYDLSAPCPAQPIALLEGWHRGEYGDGPIALPSHAVGDHERRVLREHAERLARSGYASFARFWRAQERPDGLR